MAGSILAARTTGASEAKTAAGFQLGGRLSLSKIGDIKIKLHRPVKGEIKTLTIKRENGMWYACFSCVVEPEPLPANDKAVGLDVERLSFVTWNDWTEIGNLVCSERHRSIFAEHNVE